MFFCLLVFCKIFLLKNIGSTNLDLIYGLLPGKINKFRFQYLSQKLVTLWHSAKFISLCPLCKLCRLALGRKEYLVFSRFIFMRSYQSWLQFQKWILHTKCRSPLAIWTRSPISSEISHNEMLNLWNHSSNLSTHSLWVIADVKTSHEAFKKLPNPGSGCVGGWGGGAGGVVVVGGERRREGSGGE